MSEPSRIRDKERIYPPPEYAVWWAEGNRCKPEFANDSEAVLVSGGYWVVWRDVLHTDVGPAAAMLAGNREIWITLPKLYDKGVVMHEQMHARLIPRGIPGHPQQYFGDCGIPVQAGLAADSLELFLP